MEKWVEIRKSGNFVEMGQRCSISPVTARIMRNREVFTPEEIEEYLNPQNMKMHSGFLLKGMKEAVALLISVIANGSKIRIIGDYDVDGICATYILYRGISFFGGSCDYRIPHRIEDGYGINNRMIDEAYEAGIKVIVTCDNGISASEQIKHAKELGMTVIVTDHHEVPFEEKEGIKEYIIPSADAVVDPKLPEDEYPFKGICGANVAYKFIECLGQQTKENYSLPSFEDMMKELTEFAALATVCDVMELKDENRGLVWRGMKYMQNSRNIGMRELINVTGIAGKALAAYHLGFVIGPCLNASGRLDTSLKALELFLESNQTTANNKAIELKSLNEERKSMTQEAIEKASEIVEESMQLDKVLVVYLDDCHESLAGIVAGRIREKYYRPTFVITRAENGLKGSGRSIDAYDMYEELIRVSDTMTKFGGHKLAAGVSLEADKLSEFTKRLNDNCTLTEEDFVETVRIDMELPIHYVTAELAEELTKLEPFGNGNSKPLFALRDVTIISGQYLGRDGTYGKYKAMDANGRVFELINFGDRQAFEEFVADKCSQQEAANLHTGVRINVPMSIVFEIGLNEFRGNKSAQILLKYYR